MGDQQIHALVHLEDRQDDLQSHLPPPQQASRPLLCASHLLVQELEVALVLVQVVVEVRIWFLQSIGPGDFVGCPRCP